MPMRRSPDSAFLLTREEYFALVAILRKRGREELAAQFMNLF